jgi:Co/Zn/Cd efflux system component
LRRLPSGGGAYADGEVIFGVVEVLRRFFGAGEEANVTLMVTISLIALAGNAASLVVLRHTRSQDANIKGSQICTSTTS